MDESKLTQTINEMLRMGLLAADESQGTIVNPKTIETRLVKAGIPATESNVNDWRRLVRDTPNLERYISGVILEKSRVFLDAGEYSSRGIVLGVKVDEGTGANLDTGEKVTVGLEGLQNRLLEYKNQGARFAKWRTVTPIGEVLPTYKGVQANMGTQVSYAQICQELDIVPICEPEVLIDGGHSLTKSFEITSRVLDTFFKMADHRCVYLPGTILKTSMVIYGKTYQGARNVEDVAEQTLVCLRDTVPQEVGGIVFLSGGQTDRDAVLHLNAIKKRVYEVGFKVPWPISFSYSRAIQNDAMQIWQGNPNYVPLAQEALLERARACAIASRGALNPNFEYQIKAPKSI